MVADRTERDVAEADGDDSVAVAVVEAVARHRDVDPAMLPPLADSVDPDALDGLYAHASAGNGSERGWSLTFAYAQTEVSVDAEGHIVVESL